MSAESSSQLNLWRNDITGLRALAVLPVLFFHAFPALLPGGFYGVDIFFVISGYLISGIIFRALQKGNFSYTDFYVKRIRRIIPNLLCLFFVCGLAGYWLLSSDEYTQLWKHISSSAFFFQNFRLLKLTSDYFATASEQIPLLHLWSLAIEEQFYIVFPIICAILWKLTKRSILTIGIFVISLTIGSFTFCLLSTDPSFRFYFPLTRFWEIGVGILLAHAETYRLFSTTRFRLKTRNIISVTGLLLICLALLGYQKDFIAPGVFSLLPTIGSVLIIAARPDAIINKTLLSWKPMILIGLLSYSLYLWHWPFIAFTHICIPNAPQWAFGLAVVLSALPATFVYRKIENPVRHFSAPQSRKLSLALVVGLLFCVVINKGVYALDGLPNRSIAKLVDNHFVKSSDVVPINLVGITVNASDTKHTPSVLLIGDSHAEQYILRTNTLSSKYNLSTAYIVTAGCFVTAGTSLTKNATDVENCYQAKKNLQTILQKNKFRAIVIGQIWGQYQAHDSLTFQKNISDLASFLQSMKASGVETFVLLDAPWDNSKRTYAKTFNRLTRERTTSVLVPLPTDTLWKKGNDYVIEHLSKYAQLLTPTTCSGGLCNLAHYFDDDHLSPEFLKDHCDWLDPVYQTISSPATPLKEDGI